MRSKHVSSLTDSNNIGKNGIGNIPFVKISDSSKILCDFTGANLATLSVITKRLYLFPFQISKILKINRLRVNVFATPLQTYYMGESDDDSVLNKGNYA